MITARSSYRSLCPRLRWRALWIALRGYLVELVIVIGFPALLSEADWSCERAGYWRSRWCLTSSRATRASFHRVRRAGDVMARQRRLLSQ